MPSSASRFSSRARLAKAYSDPRTPRRQRMSQNVSTPACCSALKNAASLKPYTPIVTSFIPNQFLRSAFPVFIFPRGVTLPGSKGGLAEQVHLPFRQPHDHLRLREHAAVLVYVADGDAGGGQRLADQFAAMALLRLALAAHQRCAALLLEGLSQPLDSALESCLGADFAVIHLAVRVTSGILGLAAERVAHEQIVDARALDMILEQVFRELRFELRVRRGAHVNEILDAVLLERRQELLQRARAVANREKRLAALARRRRRPLLFAAIHGKQYMVFRRLEKKLSSRSGITCRGVRETRPSDRKSTRLNYSHANI